MLLLFLNRRWLFRRAGVVAALFFVAQFPLVQKESEAALCAFRKPNRDVYILFPEATGYRSVIRKLDPQIQKEVESLLGQPLDYDEGGYHTFYLVLRNEEVIGVLRPHSERGKYGVVEIVWAFTLEGGIIDFIIQRSRERGTDKLKSKEFRSQFSGKNLKDSFTIPGTRGINTDLIKPVEGAEEASSIIVYSAKKNLILYKYFFPEYTTSEEKEKTAQ